MSDFRSPPPPPPPGQPPPGYVAYGAPAAPTHARPVRGIAKALIVLEILSLVAAAALVLISLGLTDSAEEFLDDRSTDFDDELGAFVATLGISLVVSLAAVVLLIIWSYRIAANLRERHPSLTWKPGLTIVAWIFSGCTLGILPFLMLREHWKKSDRQGPQGPVTPLITVWFVLTLAGVAAGVAASGIEGINGGGGLGQDTDDVAERLSDQLAFSIGQGVLAIASAVVLILIIRQLTDRHARYTGEA